MHGQVLLNLLSHIKGLFIQNYMLDLLCTGKAWTMTLTTRCSHASKVKFTFHPTLKSPLQAKQVHIVQVDIDFCFVAVVPNLSVDYFTKLPDFIPMGCNTTTHHLIQVKRQSFCHTAFTDIRTMVCGGLSLRPKCFRIFLGNGVSYTKLHPKSNGKVEATVSLMCGCSSSVSKQTIAKRHHASCLQCKIPY